MTFHVLFMGNRKERPACERSLSRPLGGCSKAIIADILPSGGTLTPASVATARFPATRAHAHQSDHPLSYLDFPCSYFICTCHRGDRRRKSPFPVPRPISAVTEIIPTMLASIYREPVPHCRQILIQQGAPGAAPQTLEARRKRERQSNDWGYARGLQKPRGQLSAW
ncbi:hypothetical protein BDW74DRAFT_139579 [Aspergillus multicolor]|uniref:uncharacterized protein n=1 Tax=Aspergillus multicolor TaxID=41759 RepID=UPI003CCC9E7A